MSEMFKKFLVDEDAWDMFITGPAGSGKTTNLAEDVQYCISHNIDYVVCAHTHKACGVLRSCLPEGAKVQTLHSFLRKRPTINVQATSTEHIESNKQHSKPDRVRILFVDEWSVVGEKDLMDIRAMQDPEYEGEPIMQVVWLGDKNQLLPVKDKQAIIPYGDYQLKLTKIHRTKGPLLEPLAQLVAMIEGGPITPLKANEAFIRDCKDLDGAFKELNSNSKVILAYTNAKVQELNFAIAGTNSPMPFDLVFSPSVHDEFEFIECINPSQISYVDRYRDDPLALNSKYKTLEFMIDERLCEFFRVKNLEDGETWIYPVIFGTNNYKLAKDRAGQEATSANLTIERTMKVANATAWAKQNPTHKLARKRAKAWRTYLTLKDNVLCMDFPHAMTIHKSQGSTYDHVFLEANDLAMCKDKNFDLYLRLFYVAISRARHTVTTN